MAESIIYSLIALPFIAAGLCLLLRRWGAITVVTLAAAGVLAVLALSLFSAGPGTFSPDPLFGFEWLDLFAVGDFLLIGLFALIAIKRRSMLVLVFALAQAPPLVLLEFYQGPGLENGPLFLLDNLAFIMLLIICLVGSTICVHALPYMRRHERSAGKRKSGEPMFFAVLIMFLGAMNGLVLSNDLRPAYFFFELTTLCSYLLIGFDRTGIALNNALRALWMNCVGGLAFVLAMAWGGYVWNTLDLQVLIRVAPGIGIAPLALLCLAAMVKSAQLPFQSWLLGAMVAPTPTSALLHSSTMVKAGVYLVIRLSPALAGSVVSQAAALAGGFTFIAASALAVGQSNGKRVLAYSTVSNLGLIMACAGLNTPWSLGAAAVLLVFHAVSKGLLFLCVGTIEQEIGSRDIEDMRGLFGRMPLTASIAVLTGLSMILPPFGMLTGKILAIQASAKNLPLLIMLAIGSGFTAVYWIRWIGSMLGPGSGAGVEPQPFLTKGALILLCFLTLALAPAGPWLFKAMSANFVGGAGGFIPPWPFSFGPAVILLFILAGLGLVLALAMARRAPAKGCGIYQAGTPPIFGGYVGPMGEGVRLENSHYYLPELFDEKRLTSMADVAAGLLLLYLLAGGLL